LLQNHKLLNLVKIISGGSTFDETLEYVFNSFKEYIPYNRIGIGLLDYSTNTVYCQSVHSDRTRYLKSGYNTFINLTSLQGVLDSGKPRIIHDLSNHLKKNPHSEPTKLMLKEGFLSSVTLPLYVNKNPIGFAFFTSDKANVYKNEHVEFLEQIATYIALSVEKDILINDLILVSITGLAKLVESKDSETGLHIERIRSYSQIIASELSRTDKYKDIIDDHFIKDIYDFSPIHDIGKVGIADGILLKPSKLSPEEFEVMKKHTVIGADVLRKSGANLFRKGKNYFSVGIDIAISHHEKVNGTGYPFGLKGEEIPLSARIVSVADVFDALTSRRVYKEAIAVDSSFEIIENESGKSFDTDVVKAFSDSRNEIAAVFHRYKEDFLFF
jgi:HD-GYP domain-containing protein (c-di-GMP phosphodiesterase class II)